MNLHLKLKDYFSEIPNSELSPLDNPDEKIKRLTEAAALKAAVVSATLSAPGGVVGIISSLPDLAAIWRIQAQLVADVAANPENATFLYEIVSDSATECRGTGPTD